MVNTISVPHTVWLMVALTSILFTPPVEW